MANEVAKQDVDYTGLAVDNKFINGLSAQLKTKEELGLTYPKDYNPTNELNAAYLILKETVDSNHKPVLESCSKNSIAAALLEMVTSGVSMQKKQCYPIAYKGKLKCQMSVFGNTCIARRYGLKDINAMCIYEGDKFNYVIENGKIIVKSHEQNFENINTDKIVGAYCTAIMQDGIVYTEVMNMSMIKKAWSQGYGGDVAKKFTDQMAMKTVKNRCLKYIIRTYGEPTTSEFVDKSDDIESVDIVADNVDYEISENANTEDFEVEKETNEPEKVEGEIVEENIPEILQ